MNGQTLAHVRRVLTGHSDRALIHAVDDAGLEADAIVQLPDGRWPAFEFKLGIAKADAGVATLKRVREKVTRPPHARTRPPEFVAVLTGTGEYAYQAEEGIYVIPLRALGA